MSGPFGSSQWMYASGGFYNGVATQSLRYNDDDNPYLSKTFSASNAKTWTWSGWVKLSSTTVSNSFIYSQLSSGADVSWLYFTSNNQLNMQNYEGGNQLDIMTNAKFRDTSAWYHIMAVLDTTQSTSTDRAKMYVNGELQTSLANTTYPSQNADLKFNNGDAPVLIGGTPDSYGTGEGYKLDGYLSEVNFVDGQALDPTSFGEFKNGVWIAKEYTGSYGTNGFRLQFNQTGTGTGSSTTIGADTSGNDHHFSSSGIVASDCDMPDSPENNFATANVLTKRSSVNYSEGNLKVVATSASNSQNESTIFVSSGKWYAELIVNVLAASSNLNVGLTKVPQTEYDAVDYIYFNGNGNAYRYNTNLGALGTSFATNDVLGLAYNADSQEFTLYKNNTLIYTVTGLDAVEHSFYANAYAINDAITFNFGQDSTFAGATTAGGNTDANGKGDFKYSVPSGYLALCTSNLPEPTISPNADTQADDYFNTVLWTGNGTNPRTISGVGFQPDWVWHKPRNLAYNHLAWDSSRGAGSNSLLTLFPNLTNDESDSLQSQGNATSFDSDGFIVNAGASGDNHVNDASYNYVAWNWKANGGTTSSNSDGSITSTVQANTDAGFSIVSYTGDNGSSATIGHGLGVVPAMIIIKSRDNARNWTVYHEEIGNTKFLTLNGTNSAETASNRFNDTSPSSTVFTIGTSDNVNASEDYIAYCFAEIEGYSKFGNYTGNGSNDGVFVALNFSPSFVMVKRTSATQNWLMFDNKRGAYNPSSPLLYPNLSNSEDANTMIDFVSNGFKWRASNLGGNDSGSTFIYMAFGETFKYANAR